MTGPASLPPDRQVRLGEAARRMELNEAMRHALDAPSHQDALALGKLLRAARLHAALTETELARSACLSAAQLTQLEEGGSSLFYSQAIRMQAARRVAHLLGVSAGEDAPQLSASPETGVGQDKVSVGRQRGWWKRWFRR